MVIGFYYEHGLMKIELIWNLLQGLNMGAAIESYPRF